jgi:putative ABC transport system permease protein
VPVSTARYWWRLAGQRSWRQAVALALLTGLLGAVALGAVAGARRTAGAYDRYLTSIQASDVFVNVPGKLPAEPVLRPIRLIRQLPGITASAAYLGLSAAPVINGKIDRSASVPPLNGSLDREYWTQDRMTVLAGRLPPTSATDQIVLAASAVKPLQARLGGQVTYAFVRFGNRGPVGPVVRKSFRVAAIVELPPVLVDSTDTAEFAILPPGATRAALPFYGYAWVAARLAHGTAGIPALQRELARLAAHMAARERRVTGHPDVGLSFDIRRADITRAQVRDSIRPEVVALAVFGGIAALALLVLTGQGLTQLVSRSAAATGTARMLGATRAQAALAAALPGAVAIAAGTALAVAGAIALSPLAPVGPVRRFDPARGVHADALVLGTGAAVAVLLLTGLLALLAVRSARQRTAPAAGHPSAVAAAAARAGLPPAAVIGSRNALEPGAGTRAVPVRSVLAGSAAAVTAVAASVVFGASLTGLTTHPARYGWNWDVVLQAQAGFSQFLPGALSKLITGQPAVAGWSELAFDQEPLDGHVLPVMGIARHGEPVQPPTIRGRPLASSRGIQLGETTIRQLGKHIGDTVRAGTGKNAQTLTITGTVALPSFGLATGDHVSLGRGALMTEDALLALQGHQGPVTRQESLDLALPSAVAIDLVPGTTAAQRSALVHRIVSANPDGLPGGTYEVPTAISSSVHNAAQLGGLPLSLATGLAAAAVLSLGLTVLGSVRRRRQELALLKALGMTRGQLWRIITWQTGLILGLAVAVGLPLGIAAGRWAWAAFAGSLGAVPVTEVPLATLGLGVLLLAAAGNLLTAVPAAIAARTHSGALLRTL